MYELNARDHFNCSPLLFSRPALRNRCGQSERAARDTENNRSSSTEIQTKHAENKPKMTEDKPSLIVTFYNTQLKHWLGILIPEPTWGIINDYNLWWGVIAQVKVHRTGQSILDSHFTKSESRLAGSCSGYKIGNRGSESWVRNQIPLLQRVNKNWFNHCSWHFVHIPTK